MTETVRLGGGLAITQHTAADGDTEHEAVRNALCVPTHRYRYPKVPGFDPIEFTPPLSDTVYGDGKALLEITTINDGPRYWIVRIDSSWVLDTEYGTPEEAFDVRGAIEHIAENLVLEFLSADADDYMSDTPCGSCDGSGCVTCAGTGCLLDFEGRGLNGEGGMPGFPAIDLSTGYSWSRIKVPPELEAAGAFAPTP